MADIGELKVGDYVRVQGRSENWVRQGEIGQVSALTTWNTLAEIAFAEAEGRNNLVRYHVKWLQKLHDLEVLARIEELP